MTRQPDASCNICGSQRFKTLALRSDGIPVLVCEVCRNGVVQHIPSELKSVYEGGYFEAPPGSESGYTDYAYTAEHGVAWAAALIDLLVSGGRILDIGCADGLLLGKLRNPFERFGVEANPRAGEVAQTAGVQIIGSDILNPQLQSLYAGSFDAVLAIAVFEHIADFRGAVEAALGLLKPDGLLLFEVPLITEDGKPDTWFRTSLEHIYYPTAESLRYLFVTRLGLELAGTRVDIRNFAYTYVGLTSKSSTVATQAAAAFQHWLTAPPRELAPREARFRWLLELIHAAHSSPDVLPLYACLDPGDLNPMILRRLFDLWVVTERRAESIESYLREVEKARDWNAEEVLRRDTIIEALRNAPPSGKRRGR